MAEIREETRGTDGDSSGNGRGFADHLLSTPDFEIWRQRKLDPDTGLPLGLGPFDLHGNDRCGWSIFNWDQKAKWDVKDGFLTVWEAFEAMFQEYRAWHAAQPQPVVYFIGTVLRAGFSVKIGFTRNVRARLNTLQTAHPERLKVFATVPGDQRLEEKYHRRWKMRRQQGEWFTLGDCIIDEINRLAALSGTGQ